MLPDRRMRRWLLPDRWMLRGLPDYRGVHDLPAVPLLAFPAIPALCDLSHGVLRAAGAGLRARLLPSAGLLRVSNVSHLPELPVVCDLGLLCAGLLDLSLVLVLRGLCGRGL